MTLQPQRINVHDNVASIHIESKTHGPVVVLVDESDLPLVGTHRWHVVRGPNTFYAARHELNRETGRREYQYMHRLILGFPDDHVDHISGDGLDNRRSNLRTATMTQNLGNQRLSKVNTSGVKGVCWNRGKRKWSASIQVHRRTIYLGHYRIIEDAAKAYAEAASEHFGDFARPETKETAK